MRITIDLDSFSSPDLVGEVLRDRFFLQDQSQHLYGCYSTFKLRQEVQSLPPEPVEDDPSMVWTRAERDGILMRYYWDGDGTLEFVFPDGARVRNTDCKKDHAWEWV